jgi:hypothetical protein
MKKQNNRRRGGTQKRANFLGDKILLLGEQIMNKADFV